MNATASFARWTITADRLVALALVMAAASAVAGLAVPGLYHDSDAWVRQARAADSVTLLAVVPVLLLGLAKSEHSAIGRLTVLAGLGYLAYNYAIFGFAVALNVMTPVHIAVLGLSVWALAITLTNVRAESQPHTPNVDLPRLPTAVYLLGVAALFGMLWLGQIATAITTGTPPVELTALGLATNPVYTLDLAFALPFLAFSGLQLARRQAGADGLAFVAIVWAVLMGLGVLAIFVFDAVAGAVVALPVVAVIAAITTIGVVLTALALTSRRPDSARPDPQLSTRSSIRL